MGNVTINGPRGDWDFYVRPGSRADVCCRSLERMWGVQPITLWLAGADAPLADATDLTLCSTTNFETRVGFEHPREDEGVRVPIRTRKVTRAVFRG